MKSEQLKITLIQQDLHWEKIDANLAQFEELIWDHNQSSDLIVLPEMFTTGFSMNARDLAEPMNSKTFRWMRQQAEQHQAVIAGSYMINEHGIYSNRFFAVYPDSSFSYYDKRHLFALGGEAGPFTPGRDRVIFEVKGWQIMPMICYDLRFPVWARQQATEGWEYDLLLYVANWPEARINAWDTLLQARAIENLSYTVGVNRLGTDGVGLNYVGHSNAYDFLGKPLLPVSEEPFVHHVTLSAEALDGFRQRFPFNVEADRFTIH